MKILDRKIVIIPLSFLLGAVFSYVMIDYMHLKENAKKQDFVVSTTKTNDAKHFKDSRFDDEDPFRQMDKIHKQMQKRMNSFFGSSLFDDDFMNSPSFSFSNRNNLKINRYEDDSFKYIEISAEGLNPEDIKINISDGMINISGEIKSSEDRQEDNHNFQSQYISKFNQSFNIPEGVEEHNVKIDHQGNKIIIKFPRQTV